MHPLLPRHRPPGGAALLLLFLPACAASVAEQEVPKVPSHARAPAQGSALAELFALPDPGAGSYFAVADRGDEGLDLRLALTSLAQDSIDAQSYLWHEDPSGSLLLDQLLAAADRGVRVRLLIDGFKLEGAEALDEALDLHPSLELRVFNPTLHRAGLWQTVELAEHLGRLDHRMHNKLFLVDGVAAVFGGRNVGDEYFGLGAEANFRDFDLLGTGPVVPDLQGAFDAFWNSPWTVPLSALVDAQDGPRHAEARAALRALHAEDPRLDARRSMGPEHWQVALQRVREQLLPGRARVLHDSEHIERTGAAGVMAAAFERLLVGHPGDVLIVTAYLVPDGTLLAGIRRHVAAGGRVQILTNSFTTNNQPLAHAKYQRSRRDLLEAGAELYELRDDAFSHVYHASPGSAAHLLGLHAKSAVFGDDLVVVGSMNLDPRSMVLNTEMGVAIEGRELAARVRACLQRELSPRNAWRVRPGEDGGLVWMSGEEVHRVEPGPSLWSRFKMRVLGFLPLRGEV